MEDNDNDKISGLCLLILLFSINEVENSPRKIGAEIHTKIFEQINCTTTRLLVLQRRSQDVNLPFKKEHFYYYSYLFRNIIKAACRSIDSFVWSFLMCHF
jgi:hypothetical protein